ncbi:MAG TPA: parallel beta-helix domain-containing protein, partial [Puia sp.]|nr:parallel beta-helix domain-containing protein [Puia sp.]
MKFTTKYIASFKNNTRKFLAGLFIAGIFFWSGCNQSETSAAKEFNTTLEFSPGDEAKIVEAFLSLKDSSEIHLKEGIYKFDNLSLALLKHIQIRGDGPDKTILDFSLQSQGGEGIRVTDTKFFTIRDMTIRDSKGDLLKISKSDHVDILNLHATWKNSDSTSGGYAIYPVMCHQVLIDSCYAEGSSDAGIYVGQTDSAVVRNCKAFRNVAGCEIENTSHAN